MVWEAKWWWRLLKCRIHDWSPFLVPLWLSWDSSAICQCPDLLNDIVGWTSGRVLQVSSPQRFPWWPQKIGRASFYNFESCSSVSLGEVSKHCHKHYQKFVGVLMQICGATFYHFFWLHVQLLKHILAHYRNLARISALLFWSMCMNHIFTVPLL